MGTPYKGCKRITHWPWSQVSNQTIFMCSTILRNGPFRSDFTSFSHFFIDFLMKCLLFVRFVWSGDHAGLGLSRFGLNPFDRLVAVFSG